MHSPAAMCDWLVHVDGQVYDETSWNPITDQQAENLHTFLPAVYFFCSRSPGQSLQRVV